MFNRNLTIGVLKRQKEFLPQLYKNLLSVINYFTKHCNPLVDTLLH